MTDAAYAKINLALVVGPLRADGKHELATVLQQIDLYDEIVIEPGRELTIEGFADDTLVRRALVALAQETGERAAWRVRIAKRIPVAAGLGGGSSDAAAALRLANGSLAVPLAPDDLHRLAATVGSDVPFFLRGGAQLGTGSGADLTPLELPSDYAVVLLVPHGRTKESTAAVYRAFDRRGDHSGFLEGKAALERVLSTVRFARDLGRLPHNELASSPLARALVELGAFRADVTGAGPVVYGLFDTQDAAGAAARAASRLGQTYVTRPVPA